MGKHVFFNFEIENRSENVVAVMIGAAGASNYMLLDKRQDSTKLVASSEFTLSLVFCLGASTNFQLLKLATRILEFLLASRTTTILIGELFGFSFQVLRVHVLAMVGN